MDGAQLKDCPNLETMRGIAVPAGVLDVMSELLKRPSQSSLMFAHFSAAELTVYADRSISFQVADIIARAIYTCQLGSVQFLRPL